MAAVVSVILPVFLLIALGSVLRRTGFLGESSWPVIERLSYFVVFPALLLQTMATVEIGGLDIGRILLAVLATSAGIAILLLVTRPLYGVAGPSFTSVFQGGLRQNTYIGFAVIFGLFGTDGLSVASVALAVYVPVTNALCIVALSRWGHQASRSLKTAAVAALKNPLILATLAGFFLNIAGLGLPPIVGPFLEILGRAALPLGLMAAGAGLDLAAARASGRPVLLVSLVKLAIVPAAAAGLCLAFSLEGPSLAATVLFLASPAASNSYILARQLGGDATLMASIITVQTALSLASIPAIVLLLRAFGG